jgi:integrase
MRKRPTYYLRGGKPPRIKLTIYRQLPNGKAEKVNHPRLDSLNQLVVSKTIDLARAGQLAKEVVRSLQLAERPDSQTTLSDINMDIVERYWKAEYPRRKISSDSRRSAYNALQRAIAALGPIPLTADIDAIQRRLDAFNGKRQRRLASVVNSLLTWLARPERVTLSWKDAPAPKHLTLQEFKLLYNQITNPMEQLVVGAAFYSGARLGELFAIQVVNAGGYAQIGKQMHEDGSYGPTKTRKPRAAAIHPEGLEVLRNWARVREEEKRAIRRRRWADIVTDACKREWPDKPEKWLRFHDLRHCYAIEALGAGIPIEWVAKSMGNSIVVCEEYYQGFKLSDAMAEAMADIWRKSG